MLERGRFPESIRVAESCLNVTQGSSDGLCNGGNVTKYRDGELKDEPIGETYLSASAHGDRINMVILV
jgi:hypothetical protein